jgi:hypothetical protein
MRFLFLAIPASLMGQALQINPSSAARGAANSFLVRLDSPAAGAPVSLQWDLSIPKAIIVNARDIVLGSSAESAEKSLVCTLATQDRRNSVFRCLISGGRKIIGNGTVAVVKYSVPPRAHRGVIQLRIEKALGVSQGVKKIEFPKAEGTITVH